MTAFDYYGWNGCCLTCGERECNEAFIDPDTGFECKRWCGRL